MQCDVLQDGATTVYTYGMDHQADEETPSTTTRPAPPSKQLMLRSHSSERVLAHTPSCTAIDQVSPNSAPRAFCLGVSRCHPQKGGSSTRRGTLAKSSAFARVLSALHVRRGFGEVFDESPTSCPMINDVGDEVVDLQSSTAARKVLYCGIAPCCPSAADNDRVLSTVSIICPPTI